MAKALLPNSNVQSHLRRPDGTEFREVSILTDAQGEFEHDIDYTASDAWCTRFMGGG